MEEKKLICINCPLGCALTVAMRGNEIESVEGNTCRRGEIYARKELTNPTRIVTSTVRVCKGCDHMVSVKTKEDVPKEKVLDCVKVLKEVTVEAPVRIGDVIVDDAAGTGVSIIATKDVRRA